MRQELHITSDGSSGVWKRRCRASFRARFGSAGPIVALAFVAAAIAVSAHGQVVLGAACLLLGIITTWLAGLWVWPHGTDAYSKSMTQLLRNGFAESQEFRDREVAELRALTHDVSGLAPPKQHSELHARLIGLLTELDAIERERATRASSLDISRASKVRCQLDALRDEVNREDDCPYERSVVELLSKRALVAHNARQRFYGGLVRQRSRIAGLRVPGPWLTSHQRYLHALGDYLSALESYYAAIARRDEEEVCTADTLLASRRESLQRIVDWYGKAMRDHYDGRPVAGQPTTARASKAARIDD